MLLLLMQALGKKQTSGDNFLSMFLSLKIEQQQQQKLGLNILWHGFRQLLTSVNLNVNFRLS